MTATAVTTLIVSAIVGVAFLLIDLWVAGKASKRMGPVKMIIDQMEATNATLRRIEEKMDGAA